MIIQRVLDKEVYTMDLEAANVAGSEQRPVYSKLYDARAYLEMESLHPRDYDMVVKRMATDDDYYAKYFKYECSSLF